MEILDSFKFITDINDCNNNTEERNYTTDSSLHKPYVLKRQYLRFNTLSVIQWYTLMRLLYERSIKIPDCYTNYRSFYDNLQDYYICLSKSKNLDEIDNCITRLYKKGLLKIDITDKRPEVLTRWLRKEELQFDSSVNYLKVDDEYMTIGLLFNKFMDICECDFISKCINDYNDCKDFIHISINLKNNPLMMLYLGGMTIIYSTGSKPKDVQSSLVISDNDTYFNTLLEEYSNHVLTHDAINNTMSKHIVYTDDIDVIKQVLINNDKIIHEMQSKFTHCSDNNNLHRKQDLLDTLRSSKGC